MINIKLVTILESRANVSLATKIKWNIDHNPKKHSSKSWARFEKYFGSTTVGEWLSHATTNAEKRILIQDLNHDWEHKWFEYLDEQDNAMFRQDITNGLYTHNGTL